MRQPLIIQSIPLVYAPTPNMLIRMHWAERRKQTREAAQFIAAHLGDWRGSPPLEYAVITGHRYSSERPDVDALYGSFKWLLDVLQPPSKRHPYGLGVITDDSLDHLLFRVEWGKCGRGYGSVRLKIEEGTRSGGS